MTLPIQTRRLVLRRFTPDDLPDLLAFMSDASVVRAVPEMGATEPAIRQYIDRQNSYRPFEQDKVFDLAVQRRDTGRVIGIVTLVWKEPQKGALGWALAAGERRRGFATEAAGALLDYAFSVLGLDRIEAETSTGNEDSWKVMERLRMRREGRLREATVEQGRRLDSYLYAIAASEWEEAT